MKPQKLVLHTLLHAVGVVAYVLLIGWFLFNGESLFGQINNFLGIAFILLLLVISASVMGLLVFARPVTMYLSGDKKGAMMFVGYEVAWMILLFVCLMVIIFVA